MAKKEVEAPAGVPAVGTPAPDFELKSDEGKTVRLGDLRGKRVVLYFYPKDDTPGCTTQACGFRDNYVEIQEQNAVVLGHQPGRRKQPREVQDEVQPALHPACRPRAHRLRGVRRLA